MLMFNKLPLRLLLTVPYVVLLVVLAGAVGWLSYRSADAAIGDMAAKLEVAIGERIQEAAAGYITNWQYVLAAASTASGLSDEVSLPAVERDLWVAGALSSVRPTYVYFAAPDGRFLGVQRNVGDSATLKLREHSGTDPRSLMRIAHPADRSQPQTQEERAFIAPERPWYRSAVASEGDRWSPVYLDHSTQAPMITLARARRAAGGALLGVYAADVPLAQIESFMRRLDIAQQGLAYIVSADGRIIASTLPAPQSAAPRRELEHAAASSNAELRSSFEAIRAAGPAHDGEHRATHFDTPAGRMLVSATPLHAHPGLQWRIVVALREDLLTAGVTRNAYRTVGLAALAVLAVLLVGTAILGALVREIGALTRAAEQLSTDQAPAPLQSQRQDELGRLSKAFNRMVQRLNQSTLTVRRKNEDLQHMVSELGTQMAARDQAAAALAERQQQLRRLAGELLSLQNEERRSIARELHDEMGQQLAALNINLQVLHGQPGAPRAGTERVEDSLAIVKQLLHQVRSRALDLHPAILDDFGLVAALQWLCERQARRSGVAVELQAEPAPPPLPPEVGLAAFRIAQEALANALKHGQPRHIGVSVQALGPWLQLSIDDDGRGFDASPAAAATAGRSLGLVGMRERAEQLGGSLQVVSAPQRGTRVQLRLPVPVHEEDPSPAGG